MQQDEQKDEDARDKELMLQLLRHKSEAALRELIQRHQKAVFFFAYRLLNNATDAEDVTQRTFIRVWNAASTYKPDALFSTWLFTIVKRLIFNESRRRNRKPSVSLSVLEEQAPGVQADAAMQSPGETLLQKELEDNINKALQSLPLKARMALELRRFQEMSYEDIASVLNLSVSATKSIIFRARQQLKEMLSRYL